MTRPKDISDDAWRAIVRANSAKRHAKKRSDPDWPAQRESFPSRTEEQRHSAYERWWNKLQQDPVRLAEYRVRQKANNKNSTVSRRADPIKNERLIAQRLITAAKARAEEKSVPFAITEDDIKVPSVCPILGLPLVRGNGKLHDGSPTLDRIVPELGYVAGNVAVISYKANRLKNNGTAEEHVQIALWIKHNTMKSRVVA